MPKLSKEDVLAKLEELAIIHDPNASYSDLLKLLQGNGETKTQEQKAEVKKEEPKEEKKEEKIALDEGVTAQEKKAVEEIKKNPFSSFETKLPMTGKAQEMRKKLMNQPRVPVMIPLLSGEKVGSTQQVTLNGYTMFIRKGQMVDVPLQVKEVLDEKFQHQMAVMEHPLKVSDVSEVKLQKFD